MDELNYLLKDIEIEVMNTIDDDEYSLDKASTKEEINNYLLLNAINNNPYANNKEKEIMYEFLDFFNNNPYLDTKKVYSNLVNLKFIRNYNNNNNFIIKASYHDNHITYYSTPTKAIIGHEVAHAIFDTRSIPDAYVEGVAEIIENKYFKDEDEQDFGAYNKNVAITQATIELIGKDKFLEAISTDNISIIKDALVEVYSFNNNINKETATLYVDDLFKYLSNGLDDANVTKSTAKLFESFYIKGTYDIDKLIRLNYYANILYHGPIKTDSPYYYFNEEKIKQLI